MTYDRQEVNDTARTIFAESGQTDVDIGWLEMMSIIP